MALGGYKFVGYKYTRPADYDSSVDAQVLAEVLKMHKCKLKAFTESCTASGAQWDFSYSNGDYAFGTHGNVIYKLDSSGFNLVSFFRYGEEDAYYAIVTLSDASASSGHSLQLDNWYYYYSGTTTWGGQVTNNMSCISLVDLNINNINTSRSAATDRLTLASDDESSATSTSSYWTISKSIPEQRYCGYATKGKCIISITASTLNTPFTMKVSAIDALNISSPNDTKNIFSWAFRSSSGTGTATSIDQQNGTIQTLRQSGTAYESISTYNTSYNISLYIPSPKSAIVFNPTDNIPYEAAILCASNKGTVRTAVQDLNTDGILTKGQALIDLLAVNVIAPYSGAALWHPYANGNYLLAWYYAYSGGDTAISVLNGRFVYIGWDASNPDITADASWPTYTE